MVNNVKKTLFSILFVGTLLVATQSAQAASPYDLETNQGEVIPYSNTAVTLTPAVEGYQDTSAAETVPIIHSYSRKGCPYDNTGIESFYALLKIEHVYQWPTYQTFEEARRQIFSDVQGFYNTRRIHSALAYLSPVEFEKKILAA